MRTDIWNSTNGSRQTLAILLLASSLFIRGEQALSQTRDPELPPTHGDDRTENIELRSFPLATPMTFPGDLLEEKVTSFQIKGEAPVGENGSAQLSLDSSALKFNHFGDAEATEVRPARAINVTLIRHCREEPDQSLFEISSPELKSPQTVMLLLKQDDPKSGQLLIGTLQSLDSSGSASLSVKEMVPVRNAFISQTEEVSRPKLRDNIVMHSSQNPRIRLQGQLGGEGKLMHDQNHIGLNWSTNSIMHYSTAMAFLHQPLTMEPVELSDPLDQGRRLFRLAFAAPSKLGEVFLAVSPAAAGPHRLIIREAGKTSRVLQLTPEGIEPWAKLQTAFSELPPSEQNAITRISDASSTSFFHDYIIRAGHVIYISLSGEHANPETLAQLRDLPHLFDLRINFSNVPPDVLTNVLSELKGVTSLELHELRYSPELLEAIGKMPKLGTLRLTNTPEALLTNESIGRLSAGAAGLKELDLSVFGPTDEGLLQLARLPSLKKLYLDAPHATEKGLRHLQDSMPNCTSRIHQLND